VTSLGKTQGTFRFSLRGKRFYRAFRPSEAFFAFWLRKNWGRAERRPPQFSRSQKSEKCIERAESLTETLATQATLDGTGNNELIFSHNQHVHAHVLDYHVSHGVFTRSFISAGQQQARKKRQL